MFPNITAIYYKVLFSFFTFLVITILLILLIFWFDGRKKEANQLIRKIDEITLRIQQVAALEKDFFLDETININFYIKQKSQYLTQRSALIANLVHDIDSLQKLSTIKALNIHLSLDSIRNTLVDSEKLFAQLVKAILQAGFKDEGTEGKMRKSIHYIEEKCKEMPTMQLTILNMRRNEKDFIIRKEHKYVIANDKAIDQLRLQILNLPASRLRDTLMLNLNSYKKSFLLLVKLEQDIGFNNELGKRKLLTEYSKKVQLRIKDIREQVITEVKQLQNNSDNSLYIMLMLGIFLMLLASFITTQTLTKPIQQLSETINQAVKNQFQTSVNSLTTSHKKDEIGQLSRDFSYMLSVVQQTLKELGDKSRRIENEQKLIMDSIRYAKQIQQAILPDRDEVQMFLPNFFVIYKPQKVVSGDFYWFSRKNDKLFVAVVDCTGHGVPGAFMSMIGNTLLNKIVNEDNIEEPAFILDILHLEVITALKQDKRKNDDGMDVALISILKDKEQGNFKIEFAGAKNPLIYTKKGKLQEIKGTRRSIGGSQSMLRQKYKPFENHTLELYKDDCIYLISDGFIDQPNITRKKFGKKPLLDLLQRIYFEDVIKQRKKITKAVKKHREGGVPLRDDITLLGIKLE